MSVNGSKKWCTCCCKINAALKVNHHSFHTQYDTEEGKRAAMLFVLVYSLFVSTAILKAIIVVLFVWGALADADIPTEVMVTALCGIATLGGVVMCIAFATRTQWGRRAFEDGELMWRLQHQSNESVFRIVLRSMYVCVISSAFALGFLLVMWLFFEWVPYAAMAGYTVMSIHFYLHVGWVVFSLLEANDAPDTVKRSTQ